MYKSLVNPRRKILSFSFFVAASANFSLSNEVLPLFCSFFQFFAQFNIAFLGHFVLQDEGFLIDKETYRGQQYSQIYFARLHLMRTMLYSLLPTWKPHLPSMNLI